MNHSLLLVFTLVPSNHDHVGAGEFASELPRGTELTDMSSCHIIVLAERSSAAVSAFDDTSASSTCCLNPHFISIQCLLQ